VHVQDHDVFQREGDDLYCDLPINFPTLALGGEVRVPTMVGDEEIKVPAGTQAGARFKLRGKGMPNVSGRGHGDLYAITRVAVPKKLTKEQKHLLEELAKTMPQDKLEPDGEDGAEKPFFEKVKDIFG
jgi:molecular chaperone DnaJ